LKTSGGVSRKIAKAMSIRPRKSGTKTSNRVVGLCSRTAAMQAAKCPAPLSFKSSRSTDVTTTYFRSISATASANCRGSSGSNGLGFPCATSQKGHRRVQISPIIMNVAVPWEKHSGRFGQLASSQTDASFRDLRMPLIRSTSGFAVSRILIQSGLRNSVSLGITLTGILRTFSCP